MLLIRCCYSAFCHIVRVIDSLLLLSVLSHCVIDLLLLLSVLSHCVIDLLLLLSVLSHCVIDSLLLFNVLSHCVIDSLFLFSVAVVTHMDRMGVSAQSVEFIFFSLCSGEH